MTKKEYQKLYDQFFGTFLRREFWKEYRGVLMSYPASVLKLFIEIKGIEFMELHEAQKVFDWNNASLTNVPFPPLGNCTAATPPLPGKELHTVRDPIGNVIEFVWKTPQEKGNNPMRIDNTTATAYVTAAKSDDAISRDYLLSRLSLYEGWRNLKLGELSVFFNLGEDGRPNTYLQLIDAIKNDKFTLDDKAVKHLKRIQDDLDADVDDDVYGYGPFYGLIFTDLPQANRKGYDAAVKELEALTKATKDTIMVKSPADGLAALQALEAWMPAGKSN